jgi:hypothetical protein
MIDITITACRRRELLFKTLNSFLEKALINVPFRLIINVDPVGVDEDSYKSVELCNWFSSPVVYRCPEKPNFSEAFKWSWDQAEADWVFHLEDDWELLVNVDLNDMMGILKSHSKLALLRLPQFKAGEDKMKNWDRWFPWNGTYFECPEEMKQAVGFCGHPSLIKGQYVRACRGHLLTDRNPEKQFHGGNPFLVAEATRWEYGVYSKPGHPNYIQDLGRKWSVDNGWKKKGNKAHFMIWEPINKEEGND